MRWTMWLSALAVGCTLLGCGGAEKKAETPKPTPDAAPPSDDAVHEALVVLHKKATEECFGGFGKGAPYAMSLTIAGGTISGAEATPLSEKHGEFPADCVQKHFTGGDLAGTDKTTMSARFAVENPDCDLPACPEKDLPCTFKRDIACTVIIDD